MTFSNPKNNDKVIVSTFSKLFPFFKSSQHLYGKALLHKSQVEEVHKCDLTHCQVHQQKLEFQSGVASTSCCTEVYIFLKISFTTTHLLNLLQDTFCSFQLRQGCGWRVKTLRIQSVWQRYPRGLHTTAVDSTFPIGICSEHKGSCRNS